MVYSKRFEKKGKQIAVWMLICVLFVNTISASSIIMANALDTASWNVEGLDVVGSGSSNATVTVGTNSITLKMNGKGLGGGEQKYSITFTNTLEYVATLSFDFTYKNGSVDISSPYTYILTPSERSMTINFTSPWTSLSSQTATISNVSFILNPIAVSVLSSDLERGEAMLSTNAVNPEENVTFTAIPSATYQTKQRFAYWEVVNGATLTDEQKIQNPLTLTITQATTLKAHFEDAPADISLGVTIHNAIGGLIQVGNLANLNASGTVAVGAESGELILTAVPEEGYAFAGWVTGTVTDLSAALTDTNINTSLTLTLDIGIDNQYWTAIFLKLNTYTATVREGDHGTATVGGSSSANGVLLDDVVFVATPNDGYVFDGWYDSDVLVSTSVRYIHTVVEDGDVSLEARFRNPRVYVSLGTGITSISATDANGNTYSYSDFAFEVPTGTVLTMTVKYDDANYGGVYGWYNNTTASIISGTSGVLTYSVTVSAKDQNYTVFAKDKSGNMIGCCQNLQTGVIFGSLQDAMSAAASGQTVTLIQPVVLEKDLTIPAGVTLLVPYSSTDTGAEEVAAGAIGKAYANSLTVNEGVAITVNGTLMVNAKQGNSSTVYQGNICGAYGLLTLNGNILVNGTLKARGIIQGAGRIQTANGSTVYQMVEITDWRGGSITLDIYGDMFPLNQFYIQNIQVEIEYVYGSSLKAYYFVYAASTETTGTTTLLESGNSGLFKINYGGRVVMRYEKTRNNEIVSKSIVDIYGNVEVLAFSLTIKAYSLISVTVSTEKSICPFSGAFDVNIMDGAHFKVTQKFRFMPGGRITIHKGGTLEITSTGAAYFYDVNDYEMADGTGYCSGKYRRLPMSIGKSSQYCTETEDAVLIVNGTLIVNGGLYSSAGAGNASSSIRTNANTGIIVMNKVNASGSSAKEYDADTDGAGTDGVVDVPFVSALGHLVTSADGVWEAFGVAVYFSNGEAWYTH
ncbi:MAG: hypothetical protein IJD82_02565, partial [Clostridia bacterium]|nr:hypothetical protein [Clostridia bacterium]